MHESDNFFLTIGCDTVELDTIHSLACRRRVHITTTAETENEKNAVVARIVAAVVPGRLCLRFRAEHRHDQQGSFLTGAVTGGPRFQSASQAIDGIKLSHAIIYMKADQDGRS
jgi:hypothetical protein